MNKEEDSDDNDDDNENSEMIPELKQRSKSQAQEFTIRKTFNNWQKLNSYQIKCLKSIWRERLVVIPLQH